MIFPIKEEYSDYYGTYVSHLPEAEVIELLIKTQNYTLQILEEVPESLYNYQYAEGKWTIKELLQHIIDCEQILSYRALRFARNDFVSAIAFDEDDYVAVVDMKKLSWDYILTSTKLARQNSIHLFKGFTPEESKRGGSEAFPNTVRAIAAIIAGHQLHHVFVLQERYLKQPIQKFEL
jgi:hypothetical protein